jgi:hypothetical protein
MLSELICGQWEYKIATLKKQHDFNRYAVSVTKNMGKEELF